MKRFVSSLLRYGASIAVHAGVAAALIGAPRARATHHAMVAVVDAKKPKAKDKTKEPEPPKPAEVAKTPLSVPRAAPRPAAAPPPMANTPPPPTAAALAPSAAMAALPDFGLALGGSGGGGIAIPTGGSHAEPAGSARGPRGPAPKPRPTDDGCAEEATRPKALGMVQPQYTDSARAAGVEGRVRVQLAIDASGAVTSASIASGLGHGLDESAVAAAKRMKFSAATRCGKGVDATFVVSMRFVLGE